MRTLKEIQKDFNAIQAELDEYMIENSQFTPIEALTNRKNCTITSINLVVKDSDGHLHPKRMSAKNDKACSIKVINGHLCGRANCDSKIMYDPFSNTYMYLKEDTGNPGTYKGYEIIAYTDVCIDCTDVSF